MLQTKSAKQEILDDGFTILIVSRPAKNDGVTPDSKLSPDRFDAWWKELAPPDNLVGSWYRGEVGWSDFEIEYLEHLRNSGLAKLLELIALARIKKATVFCIEGEPTHCHRRLLAEECKRIEPRIVIKIA